MSAKLPTETTVEDVLYRGWRDLRDLGNDSPGFSLEKNASRKLGILQEEGVPNGHQVLLTIYRDGRVTADLQIE